MPLSLGPCARVAAEQAQRDPRADRGNDHTRVQSIYIQTTELRSWPAISPVRDFITSPVTWGARSSR